MSREEPSDTSCRFDLPSTSQLTEMDEKANQLRRALINDYKKITLPNVQWMDSGKLTISEYHVEQKLSDGQKKIELEKIFDDVTVKENDRELSITPTRIFVTAPVGYGKTALAYKLAYDWAMNKQYMDRFRLALLVPLKEAKQSILKEIFERGTEFGKEETNVINIVKKFANETLLILDGFDEINAECKENVLKILYKKMFGDCTVIVTCTTGMFVLESANQQSLFKGIHADHNFSDITLNIVGLDNENKQLLLKKLIDSSSQVQVIQHFESLFSPMYELFECPLYLTLLAYIVTDDDNNVDTETKTGCFKRLLDCVIRRNLFKFGDTYLPHNFTLFDENNSSDDKREEIRETLYKFGKQSFERIMTGNLKFEIDSEMEEIYTMGSLYKFGEQSFERIMTGNLKFEIDSEMEEIYTMGLFVIHETKKKFNVVRHYEIMHLAFLEFAAAFSLWIDFKRNNNSFSQEGIDKIRLQFLKQGDGSLVIAFFVGLLGDKACCLFEQLEPFSSIYSAINNYDIGVTLNECKQNDNLVKTLSKFISPIAHFQNIQTLSKLLKPDNIMLKSKLPVTIEITCLEDLEHAPNDFHYESILFTIDDCEICGKIEQVHLKQFHCTTLAFHITDPCFKHEEDVKFVFDRFKLITASEKIMRFGEEVDIKEISSYINTNALENTPIHELSFYLCVDDESETDEAEQIYSAALKMIKHVAEHNQLKKLCLLIDIGYYRYLDNLASVVSVLPHLNTLWVLGHLDKEVTGFVFDMNKLTRVGAKQWQELVFAGITIGSSNHKVASKFVNFPFDSGSSCSVSGVVILSGTYRFILDLYATVSPLSSAPKEITS